jgi:prefoldin beta subunit
MTDSNIAQLQLLQQNLQNVMVQKQQFQQELMELESALKELDNTEKSYQIVGKLMIAKDKEVLKKDLLDRQEVVNLRIKSFDQQEKQFKESLEEIQKKALEEMKKDNN